LLNAGNDHDYDQADTSMYWNFAGGSCCICSTADSVVSDIYLDRKPSLVQGLFESSRRTRRYRSNRIDDDTLKRIMPLFVHIIIFGDKGIESV
jgi:hypothetical protein